MLTKAYFYVKATCFKIIYFKTLGWSTERKILSKFKISQSIIGYTLEFEINGSLLVHAHY